MFLITTRAPTLPLIVLAAAGFAIACGSSPPAPRAPETFLRGSPIIEHAPPSVEPPSAAADELAPAPDELVATRALEEPPKPPAPASPAPVAKPRAALSANAVIARANESASQAPEEAGFVNAIMSYAYLPGGFYKVLAAPWYVTDIALEPGEELLGPVAGGDPLRWRLDIGTGGVGGVAQKHVYIKPLRPGLKTNLILTTDRRVYLLDLESVEDTAMLSVRWTYPQDDAAAALDTAAAASTPPPAPARTPLDSLSFDYAIEVVSGKPSWTPRAVYDDGTHTYVRFDRRLLTGEAPSLYIRERGELQLVNYRVKDTLYIVDRLFDVAELRLGNDEPDVVRLRNRRRAIPTSSRRPASSGSSPRRPGTPY